MVPVPLLRIEPQFGTRLRERLRNAFPRTQASGRNGVLSLCPLFRLTQPGINVRSFLFSIQIVVK